MPSYPPPMLLSTLARASGFATLRSATYFDGHVTTNSSTTFTVATNRMYLTPVFVPRVISFDRIAVNTTTTAGTIVRMGLYAPDVNNEPYSLILDAGTISTTASGVREIAISVTLSPGFYYTATWWDGAPTVTCTTAGSHRPGFAPTVASNTPVTGCILDNAAWSTGLPSTLTTPSATGTMPACLLRVV